MLMSIFSSIFMNTRQWPNWRKSLGVATSGTSATWLPCTRRTPTQTGTPLKQQGETARGWKFAQGCTELTYHHVHIVGCILAGSLNFEKRESYRLSVCSSNIHNYCCVFHLRTTQLSKSHLKGEVQKMVQYHTGCPVITITMKQRCKVEMSFYVRKRLSQWWAQVDPDFRWSVV